MNKNLLPYILIGAIVGFSVYFYQKIKYEDTLTDIVTVGKVVEKVTESGGSGDYRNKGLNSFPKEILNNTGLTKLDLSGNDIESLPSEIGKLKKLQELYIIDSGLRALPGEIRMFTDLRILDVHDNELTGIPAEIGQLPKIEKIDFSGNQITALPNEIYNLTHLDELNITGNPLDGNMVSELRSRLPNTDIIF